MSALILLLTLAVTPPHTDCKPQFAPLSTGSYSGASRVPFWRKHEAGDWGGDGWLGWSSDGEVLVPVRFIVRDRPKDHEHDEDEVTVETFPEVRYAVRCVPTLRAGRIQAAQVDGPLDLKRAPKVRLGQREYRLRLDSRREDLADANVVLTDGRRTQVLYSADGFADDPHYDIEWLGDLGRDGRLDLVVNLSAKYSFHPYRLLLSSQAPRGQLVGDAALFETAD